MTAAGAVVAINMIHIAPWAAAVGLMRGAGQVLSPGGVLILYGPFIERDVETAPSNLTFDAWLKDKNPAFGVRHLDEVRTLAVQHGLAFAERIAMPANNLLVVFEKG